MVKWLYQHESGEKNMNALEQTLLDNIFISTEIERNVKSFPAFHKHNAYEIYILMRGTRNMCIGNAVYSICEGDASMLKPGVPHRSFGDDIYDGICIEFPGETVRKNFKSKEYEKILSCFEKPIISINKDMLEILASNSLKCEFEGGNKHEYLLLLAEILSVSSITTDIEVKRSFQSDMSPIGSYLQKNYLNIQGLDELTEHFRITKSHLCHLFKKQTGMSVLQYVHRLKIQHACRLVQETNIPMSEISSMCGFGTVRYFNKTFKSVIGYTPMYIRKYVKENKIYVRELDE